jgi:predicted ester cyclase
LLLGAAESGKWIRLVRIDGPGLVETGLGFCADQRSGKEETMSVVAVESKHLIREYLEALSGHAKTEGLVDRYMDDDDLKQHILQSEAAFPHYEVIAHELVAEGDMVAARCTFRGIHQGEFAGIPSTGKEVSSDFMIMYRLTLGKIVEHWMQMDAQDIVRQLNA